MEVADEVGHQHLRHWIYRHGEGLEAFRAELRIELGYHLAGCLAMRASGENYGQQDHLALVLTQQGLFAAGIIDNKLRRLTRDRLRRKGS